MSAFLRDFPSLVMGISQRYQRTLFPHSPGGVLCPIASKWPQEESNRSSHKPSGAVVQSFSHLGTGVERQMSSIAPAGPFPGLECYILLSFTRGISRCCCCCCCCCLPERVNLGHGVTKESVQSYPARIQQRPEFKSECVVRV